ncbi:hypothetical protein CEXT_12631 [Caerostris extrusa]|uniref:Uncharacterized protein n=1 Tax=Caerostris extrusa TaxID=172846 RepID=A0AAV4VXN4_CAEEX|nr:hypothetical protein CEXT_12631 [Caerostris extrusa]
MNHPLSGRADGFQKKRRCATIDRAKDPRIAPTPPPGSPGTLLPDEDGWKNKGDPLFQTLKLAFTLFPFFSCLSSLKTHQLMEKSCNFWRAFVFFLVNYPDVSSEGKGLDFTDIWDGEVMGMTPVQVKKPDISKN